MKYCIKCGAQLSDDAKFCSRCGAACRSDSSAGAFEEQDPLEQDPNEAAADRNRDGTDEDAKAGLRASPRETEQTDSQHGSPLERKTDNKTRKHVIIILAAVLIIGAVAAILAAFGVFGNKAEKGADPNDIGQTTTEKELQEPEEAGIQREITAVAGTWVLKESLNNIDLPNTVSYYGAELYITDSGKIQFLIGDLRREGTYTYKNDTITANVRSSFAGQEDEETISMEIVETENGKQIVMPYKGEQVIWSLYSAAAPLIHNWSNINVLDYYKSGNYTLPMLTYNSDDARAVNRDILEYYKPLIEEAENARKNGYSTWISGIDYETVYGNEGSIIALVIKEACENDCNYYRTYSFDLASGKRVSNSELISLAGIKAEDFTEIARSSAQTCLNYSDWQGFVSDAEFFLCMQHTMSSEYINSDMPMYLDGSVLKLISPIFGFAGAGAYENIYEAVTTGKQDGSWSGAYKSFISRGDFFEDIFGDIDDYYPDINSFETMRFVLQDTDSNGVPELFVQNGCSYEAGAANYVFGYSNGKVQYLGTAGSRIGDLQYLPGTGYNGLYWQNGNMGYFPGTYYYVNGGRLVGENVLLENWNDEYGYLDEPVITQETSDDELFNACLNSAVIKKSYSYAQILDIGWDAFVKNAVN